MFSAPGWKSRPDRSLSQISSTAAIVVFNAVVQPLQKLSFSDTAAGSVPRHFFLRNIAAGG